MVRLPIPLANLSVTLARKGSISFGDVAELLNIEARLHLQVPLMSSQVPAGFPSPADDYIDRPLDFNELLIEDPAATFAIRIDGDSMIGVGIFRGDIAIVNRARTAVDRAIILALFEGAFTVKRYRTKDGRIWLQPENPAYRDMPITDESGFEVWGVIGNTIRMFEE